MHPVLVQICITVFGLTALAMALTGDGTARRWAPIVGLVGQPFWFIATVPTGQCTHNAHVTRDRCVTAKQQAGFVLLPYPATDDMVSTGALSLVQAYNLTPEDAARESLAAMVATSPKLAPRPMLQLPVLEVPPKGRHAWGQS